MNRIKPKKLLRSKWTYTKPVNKEKHFIITEVELDEDDFVISCLIEAVMTKRTRSINWRELEDQTTWLHGWQ